jgi:ATP-binding cassette subfamily B protein
MGLAAGLLNEEQKREYSDRELLVRYIRGIASFKKSVALISFFIFIAVIAEIINPLLIGIAIEELSKINSNALIVLGSTGLYFFLSILLWVIFFLRRREIGKFVPYFLEKLRMKIFDKLQEQDMSFFDKRLSGNLNTRVSNDALDFGNTTLLLTDTLGNLLISILTLGMLLWLNLTLALITMIAIPFIFLLVFSLRRFVRIVSRAYRKAIGSVNAAMVESIEGIHVSKSYGQEATVSKQFQVTNKKYFKAGFRMTAVTHMWRSLLETIVAITLIVIIFIGGQFVFQGISNPGTIVTFILYLQKFFRPIMMLSSFFPQLSSGMAAYERILDVVDSEPNVRQNANEIEIANIEGEIVFNNIDFCYKEGEWVFNGYFFDFATSTILRVSRRIN